MKTQFELYYLYSSRFFLLLAAAVAVVYYSVLVMSLLLPSLCCESITHIYVINTFWCWLLLFSHAKIEKKNRIKLFNVNGKFSWISISDNQITKSKRLIEFTPIPSVNLFECKFEEKNAFLALHCWCCCCFFFRQAWKTSSIWNFNL